MPFSQSSQLSSIVEFIEAANPSSVLDVGTGMGQYGFLARNNLEQENLFIVDGANATQRPRENWKVRIDGIEGYRGYLTPVHEYVYNKMMIGDALSILADIPDNAYDLVLAIDILEHFAHPDGILFLSELRRVTAKNLLVSTPKDFHAQEIEANPYENHRSCWSQSELADNKLTEVIENEDSWITIYRRT